MDKTLANFALVLVACLGTALTSPLYALSPKEAPASPSTSFWSQRPLTSLTWERTMGGSLADKIYAVAQLSNGDLAAVGHTRSTGDFHYNVWVIRMNPNGFVRWSRDFGGRGSDNAYGIVATPDNGLLVVGRTRSRGLGGSDAWLMRLDSQGELLWEKTFGGGGDDSARTIVGTRDGGAIFGGVTASASHGRDLAWLVRLDANGEILWQRRFGFEQEGASGIFHLALLPGGDIATVGYVDRGGEARFDLWVQRLSATGQARWQRTFGQSAFDSGTAVAPAPNDGVVLTGITSAKGFGRNDVWVLRLDRQGELLWEVTAGGDKNDTAWSIVPLQDHFLVTASTASYGAGSSDAWLLRLNDSGQIVWQRTYGGPKWDRPTATIVLGKKDAYRGLLTVGYTTSQGAGREDGWFLRLNPEGRL